jgi:hypothetical protein
VDVLYWGKKDGSIVMLSSGCCSTFGVRCCGSLTFSCTLLIFFDFVLSFVRPSLGFQFCQSARRSAALIVNRYQSVSESLVSPFHERC